MSSDVILRTCSMFFPGLVFCAPLKVFQFLWCVNTGSDSSVSWLVLYTVSFHRVLVIGVTALVSQMVSNICDVTSLCQVMLFSEHVPCSSLSWSLCSSDIVPFSLVWEWCVSSGSSVSWLGPRCFSSGSWSFVTVLRSWLIKYIVYAHSSNGYPWTWW